MGDSWLQRLVIRGPAPAIARFRAAAVGKAKPQYATMKPVRRTQRLSFQKLRSQLPPKLARRHDADLEEPWDLLVDPARRFKDGSLELTYKFQLSRFEPETLIIDVSRVHSQLCLVLGCVAPHVDDQSSLLVHAGRSWRWRLPARHAEAIRSKLVPEATGDNDDEVFWAEAEADWALMDEVVGHWHPKVEALVARIRRAGQGARRRTSHGALSL
jgi:hypothetical protein